MSTPAKDQRAINLHTSQISHGRYSVDGTTEKVVVGYEPSMIRMVLCKTGGGNNPDIPLCRLYWYSTKPDLVTVTSDTAAGNGYDVKTAPFVVNERGFVVTNASLNTVSGGTVVSAIWETFGSEEGASVVASDGEAYAMPAPPSSIE